MNKTLSYITHKLFLVALVIFTLASCSEVNVGLPDGPQGKPGKDGKDGKDAISMYQLWKDAVLNGDITEGVDKNNTTLADFFLYLRGEKGEDGKTVYELWVDALATGEVKKPSDGSIWNSDNNTVQDFFSFLTGAKGRDGEVPSIKDGVWVIGEKPVIINGEEVVAKGRDGYVAQAPIISIDGNGYWQVTVVDPETGEETTTSLDVRAKANDGTPNPTITIDPETNNWVIGGNVSGIVAAGKDGKLISTVTISEDGYWEINGVKTNYPAFGPRGDDGKIGADGKNAYEVWKEEAAKGDLDHPHEKGMKWPKNETTKADFWRYLRGVASTGGETTVREIEGGKYNVISSFYHQELGERVSPVDGKVHFTVYDKTGKPAAYAKVKGLPGMPANKEYSADSKGMFTINNKELPNPALPFSNRLGSCTVTHNNTTYTTAENTVVPNQVLVRVVFTKVAPNYNDRQQDTLYTKCYIGLIFEVQRQYNGSNWQSYPKEFPSPKKVVTWVKDYNKPANAAGNSFPLDSIPDNSIKKYVKGLKHTYHFYDKNKDYDDIGFDRPIVFPEKFLKYKTHEKFSKYFSRIRQFPNMDVAVSGKLTSNIYGLSELKMEDVIIIKEMYIAPDPVFEGLTFNIGSNTMFGYLKVPETLNKAYTANLYKGATGYPAHVHAPKVLTNNEVMALYAHFDIAAVYSSMSGNYVIKGQTKNKLSGNENNKKFTLNGVKENSELTVLGATFNQIYADNFLYLYVVRNNKHLIVNRFNTNEVLYELKVVSSVDDSYKN